MEHIRRLSLRQFKLLRDEALRADEKQKLIIAEATRMAYHADKSKFREWYNFEMKIASRSEKKIVRKNIKTEVAETKDLSSLFEVKNGS